jgi:hypothetical protein
MIAVMSGRELSGVLQWLCTHIHKPDRSLPRNKACSEGMVRMQRKEGRSARTMQTFHFTIASGMKEYPADLFSDYGIGEMKTPPPYVPARMELPIIAKE